MSNPNRNASGMLNFRYWSSITMNPNQTIELLCDALKSALEETPSGYIEREPQEAYQDIVARIVLGLSSKGYYIQLQTREAHDAQTVAARPKQRNRGPKVCQSNLNGAGQCVLNEGHKGQHQLRMGDKWG